jgi:RHS repeat-associated protein
VIKGATVYVYSGPKVIAEYTAGSLSKEYIYSGSKLLVTIAGAAVTYHHSDHLSNRVETDASATVTRTFGHLPFGDVWYETGTADKWKFTSYERDTVESGLDYAMFRYYGSGYARFTSPDRLAGNKGNPQSLNRYAYVLNDPLNAVDPLGLVNPGSPPNPTPIGGAGGAPGDPWENHFLCALFGVMCEDTGIPLFFQGGGHGGGGGGQGKAFQERREKQFLKDLADCVKSIYNIEMTNFQDARPGMNGLFEGKDAKGKITVVTDVGLYSRFTLAFVAFPPDPKMAGWTPPSTDRDQRNYVARDLDPPEMFKAVQLHELGHSLDQITSGSIFGSSEDKADRITDCLQARRKK